MINASSDTVPLSPRWRQAVTLVVILGFILSSRDNPFAPAGDMLKQALSPAVHLHVERIGGHMGYVSGNLPDRRWLDYALEHYLNELQPSTEGRAFLAQSA